MMLQSTLGFRYSQRKDPWPEFLLWLLHWFFGRFARTYSWLLTVRLFLKVRYFTSSTRKYSTTRTYESGIGLRLAPSDPAAALTMIG